MVSLFSIKYSWIPDYEIDSMIEMQVNYSCFKIFWMIYGY